MHPFLYGLRVVLFDLDGTLVETHIDFPAMKAVTLRHAAEWLQHEPLLAHLDILAIVDFVSDALAAQCPDLARDYRTSAFAMLAEIEERECGRPVCIVGASELLAALRNSGVRVGIVTRNSRAVSERLVEFARLSCDVLVTRDDVYRTKPDPIHLRTALESLGFSPETLCGTGLGSMVGDHWMDVDAGRRLGLRTVGLTMGRPRDFYSEFKPDLAVETVGDLLALSRDHS